MTYRPRSAPHRPPLWALAVFACWRASVIGGFMWFCVASGNVFILAVGIALAGLLAWDTIKVVSR